MENGSPVEKVFCLDKKNLKGELVAKISVLYFQCRFLFQGLFQNNSRKSGNIFHPAAAFLFFDTQGKVSQHIESHSTYPIIGRLSKMQKQ